MIGVPSFEKNPAQKDYMYCGDYEVAGFGGVGSGKTIVLRTQAFAVAWGYPENRVIVGRKTSTSLKGTTQLELLHYVRILNGGSLDPGPIVKSWNKSENKLELTNESSIEFLHMEDLERILSITAGAIFLDQVEEIPYDIYNQLHGRLRHWNFKKDDEKAQERLAEWKDKWKDHLKDFWGYVPDKPKHFLHSVGNPHPGWAKLYFKERRDPATGTKLPFDPDFRFINLPTRGNIANLPDEFIDRLERRPESWRKRFLEGDWDTLEGQIYTEYDRAIHVIDGFELPKHWKRVYGMDHGYTNPTCVLACAVDEYGNHFIYWEHYQRLWEISRHASVLRSHSMSHQNLRNEAGLTIVTGKQVGLVYP
jgi:phage terminase large subunit